MTRTPMRRGAGIKQRTPDLKPAGRQWTGDALPSQEPRRLLTLDDGHERSAVSRPKRVYLRSETYRRFVASMHCAHCHRAGPSQAAHSDSAADGKGLGIKACDSAIWPGCADGPGRQGCHSLIGATGNFTREHAQALAARYIEQTQREAVERGAWPKGWPAPTVAM